MATADPVLVALVEALARDAAVSAGTVLDVRPETAHVVQEFLVVGVPGALWQAWFGPDADLDRVAGTWADVQHAVQFDLARRRGAFAPWPPCPHPGHDHALVVGRPAERPGELGWGCPHTAKHVARAGELVGPCPPPPADAIGWPGWIGLRWRLVLVETPQFAAAVPLDLRVGATFLAEGQFGAGDGTNYLSGPYRVRPAGLRVVAAMTTLAAYVGTDPMRLAVIESVRALFLAVGPGGGEGPDIQVRQAGDRLDLLVGGYRLTYERDREDAAPG